MISLWDVLDKICMCLCKGRWKKSISTQNHRGEQPLPTKLIMIQHKMQTPNTFNLDLDFYLDGTEWKASYMPSLFLNQKLHAPIQEYWMVQILESKNLEEDSCQQIPTSGLHNMKLGSTISMSYSHLHKNILIEEM